MNAFLYGLSLQWKLDIRSKALLITCYLLPLIFFALVGGIFTAIDPMARYTIIQSMTILGVSMGALVGLPPLLLETYAIDLKNAYKANGIPLYLGVVTHFLSALIHLLIMSAIIFAVAPIAFDAVLPLNPLVYFGSLVIFIAATLGIGCILGLLVKTNAKLSMVSQVVFMPSIMLSGIMFPMDMLPRVFEYAGKIFPATWANRLLTNEIFEVGLMLPLLAILGVSIVVCCAALSKKKTQE